MVKYPDCRNSDPLSHKEKNIDVAALLSNRYNSQLFGLKKKVIYSRNYSFNDNIVIVLFSKFLFLYQIFKAGIFFIFNIARVAKILLDRHNLEGIRKKNPAQLLDLFSKSLLSFLSYTRNTEQECLRR